jgi:hypothetical protein
MSDELTYPGDLNSPFERRFRSAARRVLRRRGVPEEKIDAEIIRLRRSKPTFTLPTVEEIEQLIPDDRALTK